MLEIIARYKKGYFFLFWVVFIYLLKVNVRNTGTMYETC